MQVKANLPRRKFLRDQAVYAGGALLLPAWLQAATATGYQPKLSFSTLGCPGWDLSQMVRFANQHSYTALEFRGIQQEMDLPKSVYFNSSAALSDSKRLMAENKVAVVGLGSSCTLHFKDPAKRLEQLDEGRRFVDLAAALNCPYVRVFPNNYPKEQSREETHQLIVSGLNELAAYAKNKNVTVLLETHGDLVQSVDLQSIMQAVAEPNIGLIWDVCNMWTVTNEAPETAYRRLKKYIRHVHVKDAKRVDGKLTYTFLGKGEVPIFPALDLLAKDQFSGYLSFEWEKRWHPELPEPELALADYPIAIMSHFQKA